MQDKIPHALIYPQISKYSTIQTWLPVINALSDAVFQKQANSMRITPQQSPLTAEENRPVASMTSIRELKIKIRMMKIVNMYVLLRTAPNDSELEAL